MKNHRTFKNIQGKRITREIVGHIENTRDNQNQEPEATRAQS